MAGAAVIGAQYVAGKAARDALFLSQFEPTALPLMIMSSAVVAVLLVGAASKRLAVASPARYVPAAFGVNAGARVTTAAIGQITEAAKSQVPVLGYTVPYAVSNTLLIIWGIVIVIIM